MTNELQETAVLVRDDKGRFVTGTKGTNTIKSGVDGRMMAQKRWDKARKAAASRIMQEAQAIDPTVKDEYDAHGLMYAMQFVKLADADKPNVDDAEKIAQAMGTAPRNAELRQAQATAALPMPQGDDLVMIIMRRRLEAGSVIDGDVIDMRMENEGEAE